MNLPNRESVDHIGQTEETTSRTRSPRHYCHQCEVEIKRTEEFSCPRCNGGFIEELESARNAQYDHDDDDDADDDEYNDETDLENPPPTLQSIFGMPNRQRANASGSDLRGVNTGHRRRLPRAEPPSNMNTAATGSRGARVQPHPRRVFRIHMGSPGQGQQLEDIAALFQNVLGGGPGTGPGIGGLLGGLGIGPMIHGNVQDYAFDNGLEAILNQLLNSFEGHGPPPATDDVIDNIPLITIDGTHIGQKLQCSICWEDFVLEEVVRQLACNHYYHKDCIDRWLAINGTCPVCRVTVNDNADSVEDDNNNDDQDGGGNASGGGADASTGFDNDGGNAGQSRSSSDGPANASQRTTGDSNGNASSTHAASPSPRVYARVATGPDSSRRVVRSIPTVLLPLPQLDIVRSRPVNQTTDSSMVVDDSVISNMPNAQPTGARRRWAPPTGVQLSFIEVPPRRRRRLEDVLD